MATRVIPTPLPEDCMPKADLVAAEPLSLYERMCALNAAEDAAELLKEQNNPTPKAPSSDRETLKALFTRRATGDKPILSPGDTMSMSERMEEFKMRSKQLKVWVKAELEAHTERTVLEELVPRDDVLKPPVIDINLWLDDFESLPGAMGKTVDETLVRATIQLELERQLHLPLPDETCYEIARRFMMLRNLYTNFGLQGTATRASITSRVREFQKAARVFENWLFTEVGSRDTNINTWLDDFEGLPNARGKTIDEALVFAMAKQEVYSLVDDDELAEEFASKFMVLRNLYTSLGLMGSSIIYTWSQTNGKYDHSARGLEVSMSYPKNSSLFFKGDPGKTGWQAWESGTGEQGKKREKYEKAQRDANLLAGC